MEGLEQVDGVGRRQLAAHMQVLTLLYESVLRSPQDGRREAELEL